MGLGQDLREFNASFQSSYKMFTNADYERARAEHLRAQTEDLKGPSEEYLRDAEKRIGTGGAGAIPAPKAGSTKVKSTKEQDQRASDYYNYLVEKKGYTPVGAAGIIGNMKQESSFDPNARGDGGKSFGLAQWNGPRFTALQDFAAQQKKDYRDPYVQLDFLDHELRTSYGTAFKALQGAKSVQEAADGFALHFEKPAGAQTGNANNIDGIGNRRGYADHIFGLNKTKFAQGAPVPANIKTALAPGAPKLGPEAPKQEPDQTATGSTEPAPRSSPPAGIKTSAVNLSGPARAPSVASTQTALAADDTDDDDETQSAQAGGTIQDPSQQSKFNAGTMRGYTQEPGAGNSGITGGAAAPTGPAWTPRRVGQMPAGQTGVGAIPTPAGTGYGVGQVTPSQQALRDRTAARAAAAQQAAAAAAAPKPQANVGGNQWEARYGNMPDAPGYTTPWGGHQAGMTTDQMESLPDSAFANPQGFIAMHPGTENYVRWRVGEDAWGKSQQQQDQYRQQFYNPSSSHAEGGTVQRFQEGGWVPPGDYSGTDLSPQEKLALQRRDKANAPAQQRMTDSWDAAFDRIGQAFQAPPDSVLGKRKFNIGESGEDPYLVPVGDQTSLPARAPLPPRRPRPAPDQRPTGAIPQPRPAPRPAPRPQEDLLVSDREIKANRMTDADITELNEARKAAQRIQSRSTGDPQQWGNRAVYSSFGANEQGQRRGQSMPRGSDPGQGRALAARDERRTDPGLDNQNNPLLRYQEGGAVYDDQDHSPAPLSEVGTDQPMNTPVIPPRGGMAPMQQLPGMQDPNEPRGAQRASARQRVPFPGEPENDDEPDPNVDPSLHTQHLAEGGFVGEFSQGFSRGWDSGTKGNKEQQRNRKPISEAVSEPSDEPVEQPQRFQQGGFVTPGDYEGTDVTPEEKKALLKRDKRERPQQRAVTKVYEHGGRMLKRSLFGDDQEPSTSTAASAMPDNPPIPPRRPLKFAEGGGVPQVDDYGRPILTDGKSTKVAKKPAKQESWNDWFARNFTITNPIYARRTTNVGYTGGSEPSPVLVPVGDEKAPAAIPTPPRRPAPERAAPAPAPRPAAPRAAPPPPEDLLVSDKEIVRNRLTNDQITELHEARKAAQRQQGGDPQQWGNRALYGSFEASRQGQPSGAPMPRGTDPGQGRALAYDDPRNRDPGTQDNPIRGYARGGEVVDDERAAIPPPTQSTGGNENNPWMNPGQLPNADWQRPAPGAAPAPEQPRSWEAPGELPNADWQRPAKGEARKPDPPPLPTDAVGGALKYIQKAFGLGGGSGAVQAPGDQANLQRSTKALANGQGAASYDDVKTIDETIDPQNQIPPELKQLARLNATYEFWLQKGRPDKAQRTAASLVQYGAVAAQKLGGMAMGALAHYRETRDPKDLDNGLKFISSAYSMVPDGNKLVANVGEDGQVKVQQVNHDGKVVFDGIVSPQDIVRVAAGVADGQEYWQRMMQVADPSAAHAAAAAQRSAASTQEKRQYEEKKYTERTAERRGYEEKRWKERHAGGAGGGDEKAIFTARQEADKARDALKAAQDGDADDKTIAALKADYDKKASALYYALPGKRDVTINQMGHSPKGFSLQPQMAKAPDLPPEVLASIKQMGGGTPTWDGTAFTITLPDGSTKRLVPPKQ